MDAIVVGKRGAGRVAGMLLGSVSQKLVVLSPLPSAATAQAVALARERKVEALMKGSLHTDEFMGAIVHEAAAPAKRSF